MAEVIEVRGKDALELAIRAIPLHQDWEIRLIRAKGVTVYRFPAVIAEDGGEVNPHGWNEYNRATGRSDKWIPMFKSGEAHESYQLKRRAHIAANVRKAARRIFE